MRFKISHPFILFAFLATLYACKSGKSSGNSNASSVQNNRPITINGTKLGKGISFPIVDSLKKLFSIADTIHHTYGDDDTTDFVDGNNSNITYTLEVILSNPQITKQNMDSLLKIDGLGIVHSTDKRLWLFSWYENTGGSFKSYASLVYYKTGSGKSKIAHSDNDTFNKEAGNNTLKIDSTIFSSSGASFDTIYKLVSKNKDLYLCMGQGVGCNTCIFRVATVVELKKDSADFNYPAFKSNPAESNTPTEQWQPDFLLGTRENDLLDFSFDTQRQVLNFSYLTDDNTPIQSDLDKKPDKIYRKLKFDGEKFVGDPYQ